MSASTGDVCWAAARSLAACAVTCVAMRVLAGGVDVGRAVASVARAARESRGLAGGPAPGELVAAARDRLRAWLLSRIAPPLPPGDGFGWLPLTVAPAG